jgi:hypothetical protein
MLVSGMIIGTLFTLFVVPSIYVLVARKREAIAEPRAAASTDRSYEETDPGFAKVTG